MPFKIGCGIANGEWEIVQDIINKVFKGYKVNLYKLEVTMISEEKKAIEDLINQWIRRRTRSNQTRNEKRRSHSIWSRMYVYREISRYRNGI